MKLKQLKDKFKIFFEKHPNVKKIPFLMTVVIPKYECKGERTVRECGELLENEEYIESYLRADYTDIDDLWVSIMNGLPYISDKDAFYLFDEDNLVVVENINNEVSIEVLDYSDEIWDSY